MGLEIKRNDKNQYQLKSTVSDESYHPDKKWISEDEAKRILINKQFWDFIEAAIEIDMTFPNRYNVNDKRHIDETKPNFNQWMLDTYKSEDIDGIISSKFDELYKRLGLDFKI